MLCVLKSGLKGCQYMSIRLIHGTHISTGAVHNLVAVEWAIVARSVSVARHVVSVSLNVYGKALFMCGCNLSRL
jgi:hypothetical protein